jgi:hypothetical protein
MAPCSGYHIVHIRLQNVKWYAVTYHVTAIDSMKSYTDAQLDFQRFFAGNMPCLPCKPMALICVQVEDIYTIYYRSHIGSK